MIREQGAEESNLGSMEHRVCHKIMVFYTVEIVEGAGRYQNRFREHEKLFWGASRK